MEHRDNSGAIFHNNKGDNPKRPDYRGDAMIGGTVYKISAWVKDGNKGKYMSLAFDSQNSNNSGTTANDDALPF